MNRNKRTGRFKKNESSRSFYGTLFLICYIFVLVVTTPSIPIVYTSAEELPQEPKTILLDVHINWTEDRIKQEIRTVFHEEPETFIRIARCESELNPNAHNEKTDDFGILQINKHYHGEDMESLGLDPLNVRDNLTFGRILYDKYGKTPWKASKKCWSL